MTPGFRFDFKCKFCTSDNIYLILEIRESCRLYVCRVCHKESFIRPSIEDVVDVKGRI